MGQMIELDEAIDAAGYLRLSTIERYVRHLGNVLSPELCAEASRFGLEVSAPEIPKLPPMLNWLARRSRIRHLLKSIYNRLYWVLNVESR